MALSKKTSIMIAAGILVLGVVVYMLWLRPDTEPTVSVSEGGQVTEAQAVFLTLGAQLDPVAFDARIFTDPRFQALVDIKTAILPETEGRNDPFAPLTGVAPVQR